MAQIFMSFLLTSGIGIVLSFILLLFRPLTRKIFSGSWHYYMWLIVLVVMLFPIKLNLPETPAITTLVSETATVTDHLVKNTEELIITEQETELIMQEKPVQPETMSLFHEITYLFNDNVRFLSLIWLLGAIFLFLIKVISYLVFLNNIHKHSEPITCPEVETYTKKKIETRISDSVCTPLMVGVIKPKLLLPKICLTSEELHHILVHESIHLKRNDILYKWFVTIVKCVHWFNPAIYFISKQINTDCEISCDLAVVKHLDKQAEKRYMETILSLLTHNNIKVIPLTTGMTGNKKTLKKRFTMIKNQIKVSKKVKFISFIFAVLMFISAFVISGITNGKINLGDGIFTNIETDERNDDTFNFLMLGVDNTDRVDTIMVFNFDGNTLTGMNIPRNTTMATSEDVSGNNLTELLAKENGEQKVIDAIKNTLGIPIHYFAKVKIDAVEDIIDYIGGMETDIPYDMKYEDPIQDLHINLSAGKQVLSGEQVGHLLRYRDYKNGEENRRITWFTIIDEFINQAIIGNKVRDISKLYKIATENVKTNYPIDRFLSDFNNLKNISRNNIVFRNIPGKNIVIDGYFVYHINYVEAEPLLKIFNSNTDATRLVSTIPYANDVMKFKLSLPVRWKDKYEVIQFDNQVTFLHKDIFHKYGKGSGVLFRVTIITPPTERKVEEIGEPNEYLYWGKHYAYVWSTPSDVQYPTWQDRDEEDVELAKSYEDMFIDLEFIKNTFSLVDEETLPIQTNQAGNMNEKIENYPKETLSNQTSVSQIKATYVSEEAYIGFEQVELKSLSLEEIQHQLAKQGITETQESSADLDKNYIVSEYNYKDDLNYSHMIKCDMNGNISVYLEGNSDNLVDVHFYDAENRECVGDYVILANNKNAYTFLGFNPEKTYQIDIHGKTKGSWKIEGEYIIY